MINKKYENSIIFIILLNLLSVIISLSIFKNSSYLIYFYIVSFVIQCLLFLIFIRNSNKTIDKNSCFLLIVYSIILIIPMITNFLLNIKTNYYDYFSIIIKITNFIILYCCFKKLYLNKRQLNKVFKFLIILGIIACIYNFVFCYKDILSLFTASSSYQVDIKSFFHNRNMFGEYMFISTLSTFYYFEGKKSKKKILLITMFFITAIITFSRTAIISEVMIILYFYLFKYGKRKINLFMTLFFIVLVVFLLLGPLSEYLKTFIIRSDNFTTGRSDIWKLGFDMIKINPLFGIGTYSSLDIAYSKGFTHTQYHSFFIETLLSNGICGLSFYIFLFISIMKQSINQLKESDKYYMHCIIISFIILFIKMLVESISVFSIGYSDLITSYIYISLPLLLINYNEKKEGTSI